MNFLKFRFSAFPFPCEVSNNELANEGTFNGAFASKEADNTYAGEQNLADTNPLSGTAIANSQKEHNSIASYVGKTPNTAADALPTWTNNDVGSPTDTVTARLEALTENQNNVTGHAHGGAVGDGAPIDASDLSNVNNFYALYAMVNVPAAEGTDDDVSSLFGSETAGGDTSTEGVVTSPPQNKVVILDENGEFIEDGSGNRVYGRLTFAALVWTLSYFVNISGTETAYSLPAQDINVYFKKVYSQANRPTFGADFGDFFSADLTADVVDATSTQRGVVSTGAQNFGGLKTYVDGAVLQSLLRASGKVESDIFTDSTTTGSAQTLANPTKEVIRLTNASLVSITGITAPVSGFAHKAILINRVGTPVTLLNDVGTAANRILTGTAEDLVLEVDAAVAVVYDVTTAKWQVVGGSGSGGGGALEVYATENISAAGTITAAVEQRELRRVQGNGAAVTADTTTPITAGTVEGQELILKGMSDTNTVTIQDSGNVDLNGDATLYAGSILSLVWIDSKWLETGRKI